VPVGESCVANGEKPSKREGPPAPSPNCPRRTTRPTAALLFVLAFLDYSDNVVSVVSEPPDIRLAGLTKQYGGVVAVAGIDLEVAPGEFFTLLGPSGSGKTTTLRMIAGFEDPTSGTVELAGEDVVDIPPYDRAVNTVFQDYALFPHMTVGENVGYGMKVARVPKAERDKRRDEALEMVRLPGYAERKPSELSGGQRQRVALARAIVNRPRVLLLDEPLGALDLKLREQMQVELKTIQREVGITFVYVTHDQDEALTMSDRIAVFNEGRVEQVSPPIELYEHPANEFVAGFVGISNVIERDGERLTIRPEKIELLDPAAPTNGLHSERGRVVEIAYAGMVTRFTVALEQGGTLQLIKQNVGAAAGDPAPGQGTEVLVGWRPEHAAAVRGKSKQEEVAP
jgi:putative spermidine/putrescine transport system ATP-binding protein